MKRKVSSTALPALCQRLYIIEKSASIHTTSSRYTLNQWDSEILPSSSKLSSWRHPHEHLITRASQTPLLLCADSPGAGPTAQGNPTGTSTAPQTHKMGAPQATLVPQAFSREFPMGPRCHPARANGRSSGHKPSVLDQQLQAARHATISGKRSHLVTLPHLQAHKQFIGLHSSVLEDWKTPRRDI